MADKVKDNKRTVKENVDPLVKKGTQRQRARKKPGHSMSFLDQFLLVSFALRPCRWSLSLLWDWSNTCCKEDILEALEPNWSHGRRKDQTGCTSGFWGRLPMLHHWNIMVIRAGSWWLENLKCHTHLHGGQEEDPGSYKPHLYPWERYRAKLLEAIASYMMDKAAANIPYGFTRSDSGAVDKEGEDGKCCTLWL